MMPEAIDKWEMEADVVIIGYGASGAVAAISAHDLGAKVVILEKMPVGGGNTCISMGVIFTPTSIDAVQYIEALCFGNTDKETIQAFAENALQTKDWIHKIGGKTSSYAALSPVFYPTPPSGPGFPNVPGAVHTTKLVIDGSETETRGERLWRLLSSNVERRGIRVMTDSPAQELVTNKKSEIIGVIVNQAGGRVSIKAKKAVILTCGGFEYNEAMKEAFLLCKPFYAFGNPGNTGDGIIMAQKVGAALWHMTGAEGYLGFKLPEYPATFAIRYYNKGFIYVNKQGKRFCDETGRELHDGWRDFCQVDSREFTSHPCYPNVPAFGIFDEVTRRSGPLNTSSKPMERHLGYGWSSDNSSEIAKGWITQANTIRELAKRISVDESYLENTVIKYNGYCKAGRDADFGRSLETLGIIETPPFFAIELWPSLVNTQGGPRRDKRARVLNYEGEPIPRLYAAGELGSFWGLLYNGGGNLSECLAFGRIAGRNAAAEIPWS